MKKYEVKVSEHYEKTVMVQAKTLEQAREIVGLMFFSTDIIASKQEDFAYGEVSVKILNEQADDEEKNVLMEKMPEDCSLCEDLCPVCGTCTYDCEE